MCKSHPSSIPSTHSPSDGSMGYLSRKALHLFSETSLVPALVSGITSPISTSYSAPTKIKLGRHRTALWLYPKPRESDATGQVKVDLNKQGIWPYWAKGISVSTCLKETLVWGSFGPSWAQAEMQDGGDENRNRTADGEGLIAVGYSDGSRQVERRLTYPPTSCTTLSTQRWDALPRMVPVGTVVGHGDNTDSALALTPTGPRTILGCERRLSKQQSKAFSMKSAAR